MNQNRNGVNGEAADAFVETIGGTVAPGTSATLIKSGHHDAGQLDRDLRLAGLRRHRQRGQHSRLRHRHALRPVELHLGRQHDRPPRPPERRRHRPHRRLLVLEHQLHGGREPDRRPGARPRPLRPRLGQHRREASRSRSPTPPPGRSWTPRRSRRSPAGVYLDWTISGNVVITVTRAGRAERRPQRAVLRPADQLRRHDRSLPGQAGHRRRRATGSGPTARRATTSSATRPATRLRHRHALRPVDLHLGRQHDRPARPPEPPAAPAASPPAGTRATSFTVDVDLTDGQAHDLALYCARLGHNGPRSEQIQISNAATGRCWTPRRLVVRRRGLPGLEGQRERGDHDHATEPGPTPCSAGCSSTRQPDDPTPRTATAALAHQAGHRRRRATGSGPTARRATTSSATRPATQLRHRHALRPVDLHLGRQHDRPPRPPDAGGTGRIAASWYSATSFTVDVDLTDGQAHDLALYCVDWDNTGAERADPDQQRRHRGGAGHRDGLVVLRRASTWTGRSAGTW